MFDHLGVHVADFDVAKAFCCAVLPERCPCTEQVEPDSPIPRHDGGCPMDPRISIITLGVADLERSIRFYRDGLGLPMRGDGDGIAFFETRGTWLGLYPREALAEDALASPEGSGFRGFTLAHNVASPEAVDRTLQDAVDAGATLEKPGQKVFWGGYSGYFADPDGFLWEVAWNPHFTIE